MKYLRTKIGLAIALVALAIFAVSAYAATILILAVGTIPDSALVGGGPATVTVRTLTIPPGEIGAWHYHPGYAFNVVKSGVLTVEDGCGGEEILNPGDAFEETEGRVHRAKNFGADPLVIYNTFVVPQGQPTTVNIPNNERLCGPPKNVAECRNRGWLYFTRPRVFQNQWDCAEWVNQRPHVLVSVP